MNRPRLNGHPVNRTHLWPDPTIDTLGYDVRDRDTAPGHAPYVETFWLPVIGPTTLLLLRRANSHLDARRTGEIPTELLAQSLGLGPSISRSSKLSDTIDRAERYGFAKLSFQGDELRVRTHAPPLPARYLQRLPEPLQALHRLTGRATNRRQPCLVSPTVQPPSRQILGR